jgi:phenylacetate-coenzyme A ligase PaaK-like adenylate-forming protein
VGARPGELQVARDLWRAQREGTAGVTRRQERRLAALVAHARAGSRFYRHLYADLPADGFALRDLPPTAKPALMATFDDWGTDPGVTRAAIEAFVADPGLVGSPYGDGSWVCSTSGTTGHPGLLVHDRRALAVYRAMVIVRLDLGWLSPADWLRLASRGFRWAAVVGTGTHFAGAAWIELERRRSAWQSRAYRVFSVQRPLAQLVSALNAFDPAMLSGYPSALELLAEEQAAGRLRVRPTLVETAGESATPTARKRMAAAFGRPIHDVYASSECQVIAVDCPCGWLHVNSDWAILEPVDDDLRPTPPGEPSRTVLLTNLANRIQPIIRYDLGDSVLVRPDPCPCGSPFPAIRVEGRRDDVLRFEGVDGRTVVVLPLAIGAVIEGTRGVHRSQLIQAGPTRLRLRLEPEAGLEREGLWQAVLANLHAYLADQGLANVELVRANEPPEADSRSGKFRQVITQVSETRRARRPVDRGEPRSDALA